MSDRGRALVQDWADAQHPGELLERVATARELMAAADNTGWVALYDEIRADLVVRVHMGDVILGLARWAEQPASSMREKR